jgi:transposase
MCWRDCEVYCNDAAARDAGLTPEERLRSHQEHSGPIMDALHEWLEAQFAERKGRVKRFV